MKKMVAVMLLSLCLVFSVPVTAFASDIFTGDKELSGVPTNTGDILSPDDSVEEQLAELSDAQKEIALKKLNPANNDIENQIIPRSTTWTYLPGFTMYKQETTYYCVVASCKAAIQYLNGSSDSQSKIASELGTTSAGTSFSAARTYLNNHQSKNPYVSQPASISLSDMQGCFYSGIVTYDAPPLISVQLLIANGWLYNTDGHTMCVYGARNDREYYKLADPYVKWTNPNASMYYNMLATKIYTAISNRGNGFIY